MNFESLKLGFFSYLKEKSETNNNDTMSMLMMNPGLSIFMYGEEFKNYLVDEVGADVSIFSKDMSEIMSIGFENGQFIEAADEYESENQNIDNLYNGMLNELFKQDNVKTAADINKDGELNQEEIYSYLDTMANQDNNKESLSLDDILAKGNDISTENFFNPMLKSGNETTPPSNASGLNGNNYSLNFLDDIGGEFSDSGKNILGTLFDKNKDGTLSAEEEAQAKTLLSMLDGKNDNLSKDDIDIIKKYISGLSEMGFSTDEIVNNIKGLDGNIEELSTEDFKTLSGGIADGSLLAPLQEAAAAGIQPNSVMESNGEGTQSSSSGKSASSPAIANKDLKNLSIEDLEKELQTAKDTAQTSYDSYLQQLETINAELASKIKDTNLNIEKTQGDLDTANSQLAEYTQGLNEDNTSLTNSISRVGEIDGSIDSLKKLLDDPEADAGAIQAKIEVLEAERDKLSNETIPALETSIAEKQAAIDKLTQETIPELEKNLEKYNQEAAQYEQEINSLAETNPELKTQLDNYNAALEHQNTVEQTLQTRKADQEKEAQSDRPDISEAPEDYRNQDGYDFKNMPLTYNLDGKEYHCVGFEGYDLDGDGKTDFKPDSWEEAQRYLANGGIANIGKYGGMQCHNYSDFVGQIVLGAANQEAMQALVSETEDSSYGNLDQAGKLAKQREWNPRNFAQCRAKDRDEERAIIENELQNGRPCLVSIPTSGGAHWGLVAGMADDGDILIWDSYDGAMKKLGKSSNSDANSEWRNMATGNGIMVFAENYSYQYGTYKLIDYWQYVNNSPEYVMQNGYR